MFSRPMLDTRQEFQPSMNLRAPMSVSMVVLGLPMPSNSEPLMASSSTVMREASLSTRRLNLNVSPM